MRIEWIHHLWAWAHGYFWNPCPNCGQMFGGHEIGERWYKDRWTHYGLPTCSDPECVMEVQAHNLRMLIGN
jgi:hypothetical protein